MAKRKRPQRPAKVSDVLSEMKPRLAKRRVRFSVHALQQMKRRHVIQAEVFQALENGYHETSKDEFVKNWRYAIRGRTIDKKRLRVCIAFVPDQFDVVTVIDLDLREDS